MAHPIRFLRGSEGKEMKCEDCHINEGVLTYSESPMLTITHGWGGRKICRKCFIYRIERHIQDCKKQLREQKELLKEEKK
jgi:cytochrome c